MNLKNCLIITLIRFILKPEQTKLGSISVYNPYFSISNATAGIVNIAEETLDKYVPREVVCVFCLVKANIV